MASSTRRVLGAFAILVLAGCSAATSPAPSSSAAIASAGPFPSSLPTIEPSAAPSALASESPATAKCPTGSPLRVAAYVKAWQAEWEEGKASCFDDRDVTILAWADAAPAIGFERGPSIKPTWLWYQPIALWDHWCAGGGGCQYLIAHVDPDSNLDIKTDGRWLLVTGHTGDATAEMCHYVYPDDWSGELLPDSEAQATCRSSFVVTSIADPWAGSGPVIPPGSRAEVRVNDLRLRAEPSLDAEVVRTLDKGAVVVVGNNANNLGPVLADGYAWYPVDWPGGDRESIGGWVAQDRAGTFLSVLPARCGQLADLTLESFELLSCYGDDSVTIEGTYGYCGCGATPGYFKPSWLAHPLGGVGLRAVAGTGFPGSGFRVTQLRLPPALEWVAPDAGSVLRVVGHFDDPAASRCQIAMPTGHGGLAVPNPRVTLLYCREQFVVDSYKVIGVDPSYQPQG